MKGIDPITLEVVQGSFVHTVRQMRATIIRTSYAPILYDTHDFSCGLLSPQGELAQSLIGMSEGDFSGHVFSFHLALHRVLDHFKEGIFPGDVIAMNDPYTGGTHLNDVAFYTPFFYEGKLLIYIAVRAHWADVGGATPGSFSGQDTEIYQEGVRLTPVKLIEKGKINQGLWDVIFANMRLSDEQEGNALAMLDTARVAEMRLTELCAKYGVETVEACRDRLLERAERRMRDRISQLPPGEYYAEHYCDSSGLTSDPLPIKVKLIIEGDAMTFDFTGSAPQVLGPMNAGPAITQGGTFVIVKSWLDPDTPVNGGTFRPLNFIIPEGSVLSCTLPSPVGGVWEIYRQVQSAVAGAFAQVMPQDAGGATMGTVNHCYVAGYDITRNKHYILYEYPAGGMPATGKTDGATACQQYDCGDLPSIYPAESSEQRQPLLIESTEVRTDGEGAGYRRSGFGIIRQVKVLSNDSQLNVMQDGAIIPAWGAGAAPAGSYNMVTVIREEKELQPSSIPGKIRSYPLQYGDIVQMKANAGGGVGDALDREVELVMKDVWDGYVSLQRAREVYGVVIENDRVDLAKTKIQRQQLRKQRYYVQVAESKNDEFDAQGCRLSRLSKKDAAQLGVKEGDMVEFVDKAGAPLRSWVRLADGKAGQVALGPVGRKIIHVAAGDQVWIRALPNYK